MKREVFLRLAIFLLFPCLALGQLEFVSCSSSCYYTIGEELKVKHCLRVFTKKKRHWNVKHGLYLIYCAGLVWIFLSHCTRDTMQSSVFTKPSECHVANLVMYDWGLCLAIQDPLQQLYLRLKHSFNSWHYLSFMLFSSHIEIISKRWWRKLLHLVLI